MGVIVPGTGQPTGWSPGLHARIEGLKEQGINLGPDLYINEFHRLQEHYEKLLKLHEQGKLPQEGDGSLEEFKFIRQNSLSSTS